MKMGHFFQYTAGTLFFDIVEARHFKMQARHFNVALYISGPSTVRPYRAVDRAAGRMIACGRV